MYGISFEEYKGFKCTMCDNIIDFDYYLYNTDDKFDYFIIDLALESPDITPIILEKWCAEQGIEIKTIINNTFPLIGWDYFIQKIVVNPKTEDILEKFILISGFKDKLKKQVPSEDFKKAVNIFSKGENDLWKNITAIIYNK
jgi:hypothetical protein